MRSTWQTEVAKPLRSNPKSKTKFCESAQLEGRVTYSLSSSETFFEQENKGVLYARVAELADAHV
ncbi:MAG: hypothetical protein E7592_00270 [Ruminococcaceae bacterium]|nr:hypothetical protein [Oscillospiraceae bacterium]